MTALSAAKALNRQHMRNYTYTAKSGETIYKGALVAFELGTAFVVEATGASDELVIGTAMRTVDASAAATACPVEFERDFDLVFFANGSSITASHQGAICYVADDQTVSLTPTASGASVAGRIWVVESTRGVGVELLTPISQSGGPLTERSPGAFAAGDLVIGDSPASGTVYDIPTTAGASTVTLPATATEGTIIHFVADGTKNGHTVQYRDATGPTNLTTALLASKRHQTSAVFLNGIWTANTYVSP